MQHEVTKSTKYARRREGSILLLEDLVIVELKSVERLEPVHQLSY